MAREFDRGMIPGCDVEMCGYQQYIPFPEQPEWPGDDDEKDDGWLPKTDWSRDGIIANGQE